MLPSYDTDRHPQGCGCLPCSEYLAPCLCCGADVPLSALQDDHCAACIEVCDYAGCRLHENCSACIRGWTQGRYVGFTLPEFRPRYEQAPCAVCRMDDSRRYWLAGSRDIPVDSAA